MYSKVERQQSVARGDSEPSNSGASVLCRTPSLTEVTPTHTDAGRGSRGRSPPRRVSPSCASAVCFTARRDPGAWRWPPRFAAAPLCANSRWIRGGIAAAESKPPQWSMRYSGSHIRRRTAMLTSFKPGRGQGSRSWCCGTFRSTGQQRLRLGEHCTARRGEPLRLSQSMAIVMPAMRRWAMRSPRRWPGHCWHSVPACSCGSSVLWGPLWELKAQRLLYLDYVSPSPRMSLSAFPGSLVSCAHTSRRKRRNSDGSHAIVCVHRCEQASRRLPGPCKPRPAHWRTW